MAWLVTLTSHAQSSFEEDWQHRLEQKLHMLNNYIYYISDKENNYSDRKEYRAIALNLFIEHGEPYYIDEVKRRGACIQIRSKYRGRPRNILVKDYLTGLITMRYDKIRIESIDYLPFSIGSLRKVDEDKYECTGVTTQAFCGFIDGKPIFKKINRKRVKMQVYIEKTIRANPNGELITENEYHVMLGDIQASEIIKN